MTLRKTQDLLQEKEKQLAELASKSASAIQLVWKRLIHMWNG